MLLVREARHSDLGLLYMLLVREARHSDLGLLICY